MPSSLYVGAREKSVRRPADLENYKKNLDMLFAD